MQQLGNKLTSSCSLPLALPALHNWLFCSSYGAQLIPGLVCWPLPPTCLQHPWYASSLAGVMLYCGFLFACLFPSLGNKQVQGWAGPSKTLSGRSTNKTLCPAHPAVSSETSAGHRQLMFSWVPGSSTASASRSFKTMYSMASKKIAMLVTCLLNDKLLLFSHQVMSNSLWPHGHARQAFLSFTISQFAQTHVHWVSDAIQLSHPLSSPSPLAHNLSQHQGLFQWVSSLNQVAKYWSSSFWISPASEYSGLISFRIDWFDLAFPETLKHLLPHHSSKASNLLCSAYLPNDKIPSDSYGPRDQRVGVPWEWGRAAWNVCRAQKAPVPDISIRKVGFLSKKTHFRRNRDAELQERLLQAARHKSQV